MTISLINRPLFLNNSRSLFIVPPFDAVPGVKASQIPQNKGQLKAIMNKPVKDRKVSNKLLTYENHNYSKWLEEDNIYELELPKEIIFEPYFVTHRKTLLYDEIFVGCGYDKVSYAQSMRALDYKLEMLPETFMVHLHHNDLKNYSNWCKKYHRRMRYQLKRNISNAFDRELRGLLVNDYYPQWNDDVFSAKCPYDSSCRGSNFQKKLIAVKNKVSYFKEFLYILLTIFGACVVVLSITFKKYESIKN